MRPICHINLHLQGKNIFNLLLVGHLLVDLENFVSDVKILLGKHGFCFFDSVNKVFNKIHQDSYFWVVFKTKQFV